RYSLVKENCDGGTGICYRLTQSSSAGQYAQQEAGDKNQVGIARAFLDGELFDTTSKAFSVAEHLDYLSQKGSSQAYLKALTALAPDVSNGMSRQQAAIQGKISNTLSARLNSLSGNMGLNSRTYRNIQKMYGRSGGSPYKSRFMRTSDYYKNAGYYEDEPKPVSKPKITQDRPHVDSSMQQEFDVPVEDRRWTKKKYKPSAPNEFGVWAQAFLNKADYSSTDKPEGFSGDTTGFAVGADVTLYDVFALGAGYASTSSTVDSLQRSTDIDGHSFFVYGMYKPSEWFVSSVLNMGWMSYTEDKNLSGLSISDKYDGTSFGGSLMVGRELKSWTPAVGIRYVSSKRDAHEDSIGQKIGAISSNMMTFVAEGRMDREFGKTDSSVWHSELSAAVTYDLSSSKESAAVNLPNGGSYTVDGDDFDPMGVELGGTLSWLYGKHIDISAGYNLEWRPDYLSHTLTATFRYSF
ncbi:MAG: autotransporter outer membrane beta-barrel domain-containing protein, partial [Alphaproteobacteria bacterium]|nr:autotransporter outer membrane beta-barrel domain-containing protein [Alphaproteobacteria bacterium]